MCITNKAISTKFLNIIIRTNHGQTEIIMQYGGLRSSVTCVTISCSNDGLLVFVKTFLNQNHIRVLLWPALSPDLSPIEHLRDKLGRRVRHVTIGSRVSSLNLTAFNVPWTILSWVRPSWQIPDHNTSA
jgi:transposase